MHATMVSTDYTKEVGIHTHVAMVPLRIAIPLLSVLGVVVAFGVITLVRTHTAEPAKPAPATAQVIGAAPVVVASK